jgi:hypothetical protein
MVALLFAALSVVAGIATLAYLLSNAGPLTLCDLWPPPHCGSMSLSGLQYFAGDSQAAPVWSLTLSVVGPWLAVGAALLHLRRQFAPALVLAALACVPYAAFLLGTYAVMPLHPLVAGAVLATFIAVSLSTAKAVWSPPRARPASPRI